MFCMAGRCGWPGFELAGISDVVVNKKVAKDHMPLDCLYKVGISCVFSKASLCVFTHPAASTNLDVLRSIMLHCHPSCRDSRFFGTWPKSTSADYTSWNGNTSLCAVSVLFVLLLQANCFAEQVVWLHLWCSLSPGVVTPFVYSDNILNICSLLCQ